MKKITCLLNRVFRRYIVSSQMTIKVRNPERAVRYHRLHCCTVARRARTSRGLSRSDPQKVSRLLPRRIFPVHQTLRARA